MCLFHYWDYFWPFGGFFNILFLALVIYGIVYLCKNSSKQIPDEPRKQDEAMEILRKRYASGEIKAEQFEKMKKDLGG